MITTDAGLAIMRRALEDRVSYSALLLLTVYFDVVDDRGETALSTRMLHEATKLCRRIVISARAELLKRGYLADTKRDDAGVPVLVVVGAPKCTPTGAPKCTPPSSPRQLGDAAESVSDVKTVKKPRTAKEIAGEVHPVAPGASRCTGGPKVSFLEKEETSKKDSLLTLPGMSAGETPNELPKLLDPPTATEVAAHERFWREYPRQRGKENSLRAFVSRQRRRGDEAEAMIRGAKLHRDAFERECKRLQVTPHERNIIIRGMKFPENYLKEGLFKEDPDIDISRVVGQRKADEIKRERASTTANGRLVERKPKPIAVDTPEWHERQRAMGLE